MMKKLFRLNTSRSEDHASDGIRNQSTTNQPTKMKTRERRD
jgi:hypothetical protein